MTVVKSCERKNAHTDFTEDVETFVKNNLLRITAIKINNALSVMQFIRIEKGRIPGWGAVCCGTGLFSAQVSSIHLHLRWSNPLCHRLKLTASVESAFIILPTVFQALLWLGPLNKEFCMSLYFPRIFWCSGNNKDKVASFLTILHKPKQLLVEVETSFKVLAAHWTDT